ncbi:GlxA family transcriptional regulator [Mucilaginibacter psychrotolerans]|uniref:Helix-turn-helix domain-containing protein n=1 Tax=Mucilaginibacter psychrotolerans TaxID=1524096 RepID=A0A4Y8SN95_9SPHI|nr:helix-turn-helix domain-containing protein [Mucilaginibacter psychrotolerans]TFF40140.1 helix-turn-helix domain-containing protein [Mucilaginibacter psychrotolerans]
MKHLSILIPKGNVSLSNIESTYKMFTEVNNAFARMNKAPLFKIQLVGLSKETTLSNGLFVIKPDYTLSEVTQTDLVVIPAVHGDMAKVVSDNQEFIPWIIKQYKGGAEVVSLCIGAFILASTGLLKGRNCTTHWLAAAEFRAMFPDVNLMPYKIITDEGGIYTSGGAYSSLNLLLYLIEKFSGRDMAISSSKMFEIDIERNSQSLFIIFHGQKNHEDDAIKRAQEFIELNYSEKITVDHLASTLAMSRRHLERRFKKATSNTVVEYLQRVRIEAAKMSLETLRENVNEVMYNVGYTDTKAFRETFKKITGVSPLEYRNKYSKNAAATV